MRSSYVTEADSEAGELEAPTKPIRKDQLNVQRALYNEVQREFRFHDDANTSLDKKAQNLMIAAALVAALFASVAMNGAVGQLQWDSLWLTTTIAFMVGMIATIVLCVWVNLPRPQPVAIVGGALLCCDRLDNETYAGLVADGEEDYYKSRIEEYALALTKQEHISGKKAKRLLCAYFVFTISLAVVILRLFVGSA